MELLTGFHVRVFFGEEQVYEDNWDMRKQPDHQHGYRLCYGNSIHQEELIRCKRQHLLPFTTKRLPDYEGGVGIIHEILNRSALGLTFEYDEGLAQLSCTSHSESSVYFCARDEAVKLKREHRHVVFDHAAMLKLFGDRQSASHMRAELVIGTRPHRQKLVKVLFRPWISQVLRNRTVPPQHAPGYSSIDNMASFEEPDSLDYNFKRIQIH